MSLSLTSLPHLPPLSLTQVPLFTGKGSSEVRPIVIGRIKQLQFFNGSGVGPRERTDAEKTYLRSIMYALEDAQAAGATLDVAALHPRHVELQGVHGADMLPMGKVRPPPAPLPAPPARALLLASLPAPRLTP